MASHVCYPWCMHRDVDCSLQICAVLLDALFDSQRHVISSQVVRDALEEDAGGLGDVTTLAT